MNNMIHSLVAPQMVTVNEPDAIFVSSKSTVRATKAPHLSRGGERFGLAACQMIRLSGFKENQETAGLFR